MILPFLCEKCLNKVKTLISLIMLQVIMPKELSHIYVTINHLIAGKVIYTGNYNIVWQMIDMY